MSEPEKRFWLRLRSKQFFNLKFRRQHGIGQYIVDFYCPERQVVIELDGDTHGETSQIIKDEKRQSFLKSLGIKVVRYTNEEIMKNIEGVLEDLSNKLLNDLPPLTPPYKGGGSD